MKKIYNNIIPAKGYKAITIWPFIFVRKEYKQRILPATWRHEHIHGKQQKEMLLIGFYLWYIVEYLVRLIQKRNHDKAYRSISFEKEAYGNQYCQYYLDGRHPFAWLSYL